MKESIQVSRKARGQQDRRRLAVFTCLWLISLAMVYVGHRYFWEESVVFSGVMVLANVLAGIAMMWANKKLLNGLDELEQKIQLEAMAFALGTGLVGGFAYSALSQTGVLPFDAHISHLAVLMALTYLAATVRGVKKYQ